MFGFINRAAESIMRYFVNGNLPNFAKTIFDSATTNGNRFEQLQAQFDAEMSALLPNYVGYHNNTVSFSVELDGLSNKGLFEDAIAALEKLTGFEHNQSKPGQFVMRINHIHDEYGALKKELNKALAKVKGNKEQIDFELQYVETAKDVERAYSGTYKNVTSPADAAALAAGEKKGATVTPKSTGEHEI